jgi:hypothetical protein
MTYATNQNGTAAHPSHPLPLQYGNGYNGGAGGGGANTHYYQQAKCAHAGFKVIFKTNEGHAIYAGARDHLAGDYSLIMDCTGQGIARGAGAVRPVLQFDGALGDKYAALTDFVAPLTPRILVAWPDGGAPELLPAFWQALLARLDGPLAVCCIGGHGRTGTALACLLMADLARGTDAPLAPLSEIVRMVRKVHCESAIETDDQCIYLEEVADFYGVEVDEQVIGSYEWRKPVTMGTPPAAAPPAAAHGIKTSDTNVAPSLKQAATKAATGKGKANKPAKGIK